MQTQPQYPPIFKYTFFIVINSFLINLPPVKSAISLVWFNFAVNEDYHPPVVNSDNILNPVPVKSIFALPIFLNKLF